MEMFTVIGAGVAGLTVAIELVNSGQKVQIFEPHGSPGPYNCSWWAGGMLAPLCERENAEALVQEKGAEAIAWWSQHTKVTQAGTLVVTHPRDLPELQRFAQRTEGFRKVNESEIAQLEPDLHGFSAGLFYAEEAHLVPRQALYDLWQKLQASGVEFHQRPAPTGLRQVIDCTGLSARTVLPDLRGVKGEMLHIRCTDIHLNRPVRFLHPRIPLYVVPRGDGVYMIGATTIENESQNHISVRSMLELLSAAFALNPSFGEAEILEIGTELRPAFPDNLPRVCRVCEVIYVNGLYRHGYLLAPSLARSAVELALTKKTSECNYANIN